MAAFNAFAVDKPNLLNATNPAPAPVSAQRPAPSLPNAFAVTTPSNPVAPKQSGGQNLLAKGASAFARGFIGPEGVAKIEDRRFEVQKRDKEMQQAEQKDRLTKSLAWLEQTKQVPEAERAAWTMQNAEQIFRDTGQRPDANGRYDDGSLDQGIAAIRAQAGISPEQAEYLNLGGGAVGKVQNGNFTMAHEAPKEPVKPTIVNNRVIDPNDPTKVIADYSDPAKPDPANYDTVTMADGIWAVNKRDPKDKIRLGAAPAKKGDESGDGGLDAEAIRLEREYAKDWKSVDNNFSDIRNQYQRIQTMANRGDSAGDLALVVSFTKMLDPGSVAREGEVALTQKAASLVDEAANWVNRLQNGQTLLPPKVRQQLLEAAGEMYQVYDGAYQNLANSYFGTAQSYGFDPERVMMGADIPRLRGQNLSPDQQDAIRGFAQLASLGTPTGAAAFGMRPTPQAQPQATSRQPGAIDVDDETGERYRFKGGDDTDPNNWELIR